MLVTIIRSHSRVERINLTSGVCYVVMETEIGLTCGLWSLNGCGASCVLSCHHDVRG